MKPHHCWNCSEPIFVHGIVSGEVWAALTDTPESYFCLLCMDQRARERGIEAEVQLIFDGRALRSPPIHEAATR